MRMQTSVRISLLAIFSTPGSFENDLMPRAVAELAREAVSRGESAGAVTRRHAAQMLRYYRHQSEFPELHELVRTAAIRRLPSLVEKVAARMVLTA